MQKKIEELKQIEPLLEKKLRKPEQLPDLTCSSVVILQFFARNDLRKFQTKEHHGKL